MERTRETESTYAAVARETDRCLDRERYTGRWIERDR